MRLAKEFERNCRGAEAASHLSLQKSLIHTMEWWSQKSICQFGENPFAIANLAYTSWLQQSLIFKLSTWSLLEYFICSSSIALLSKQKVWCKIFLMPAVFLSDLIRLALTRFGGTLYLDIPRPHPNIGHDIWHNTECFFNWSSIVKSCFKYGHWGRGIGASLNSYIFTQYL